MRKIAPSTLSATEASAVQAIATRVRTLVHANGNALDKQPSKALFGSSIFSTMFCRTWTYYATRIILVYGMQRRHRRTARGIDLADSARQAANAIIAGAIVPGFDNRLYSVGPYGIRVGFQFQQERALNLAWALHVKGIIKPDFTTAIIGAGLAGVTLRIALYGLGYSRVDLFEKERDVALFQSQAEHREIHPNYNTWPMSDRFSPTTNLPFLNWYAEKANSVVHRLRQDWQETFQAILPKIFLGRDVTGIAVNPGGVRRLRVNTSVAAHDYDVVVMTTGFGEEQHLRHSLSKSYWVPDKVESMREARTPVTVVGIGDGGLLDCIRLCCAEPKAEPMLALEFISMLRKPKYRWYADERTHPGFELSAIETAIRTLEEEAEDRLREPSGDRGDFGSPRDNEIAGMLAQGYASILEDLPDGAVKLLDSRIENIENVTLVGRLVSPFTCATAPINKLITAYLLSKRGALYAQGRVDWSGEAPNLVFADGRDPTHLSSNLLLRLGGKPPVYGFVPKFENASKSLDRALSEITDLDRPDIAICKDLPGVACADPARYEYISLRMDLIEDFARKRLGFDVSDADPGPGGHGRFLSFNAATSGFRAIALRNVRAFGGFPHDLFGIPLRSELPVHGTSALGLAT